MGEQLNSGGVLFTSQKEIIANILIFSVSKHFPFVLHFHIHLPTSYITNTLTIFAFHVSGKIADSIAIACKSSFTYDDRAQTHYPFSYTGFSCLTDFFSVK